MSSKIRCFVRCSWICFLLLIIQNTVQAQIPAGSILWLKADNGITETAGRISSWDDVSGRGNAVNQVSDISRPTLLVNVLNGHSAVKFHGWNEYLVGPSVFPYRRDYSITAVLRIDDTTAVNNILSGTDHAFYFNNDLYPRAINGEFQHQAVASLKIDSNFNIVTIRFSDEDGQAKMYVNGQFADSLFIDVNVSDSSLLIGTFRGGYNLNGAIAELIVYDRQISEGERVSIESDLRSKYDLPLGSPMPKPDPTFSQLPADLQLYPRNSLDSAEVPIEGKILVQGFDSIIVEGLRSGSPYYRESKKLEYSGEGAPFSFRPIIHAELSEYRFIVHLKRSETDSIIADRHNIVCGDVFLIGGESNATFGFASPPQQNEFCRSFGLNGSHNVRDTLWALSEATYWGDDASVSGWGFLLQQEIAQKYGIPNCIIDGGLSATNLPPHLRNDAAPTKLTTIYGRLLFRCLRAKVASEAKAIFWWHGENDVIDRYYEGFKKLYQAWTEDYPNLRKVYVMQLRPAFCVDLNDQPLRELMRTLPDSLAHVTAISTTMFPNQDGCHFRDGFSGIEQQIFPIVAKDFYGSTDTVGISSPNVERAFYTTDQNTEIALIFSPGSSISASADTTIGGITATIKDYFYPNDEIGKIKAIRFSGDTIFLQLYSSSNATFISYVPDRYYNGSDSVYYEGPWLKSERGIGALIFYHFPIDSWKSDTNGPVKPSPISLDATPNPTISNSVLRYYLPRQEQLTLAIYDVLGKKLMTLFDGKATEGYHDVTFDTELLPAGEYFCRLQAGNEELIRKIILAK